MPCLQSLDALMAWPRWRRAACRVFLSCRGMPSSKGAPRSSQAALGMGPFVGSAQRWPVFCHEAAPPRTCPGSAHLAGGHEKSPGGRQSAGALFWAL